MDVHVESAALARPRAGRTHVRSGPVQSGPVNVQQRAALDLQGEPERDSRPLAEPGADAPDVEDPPAWRPGPFDFSEQEFRRLCALVRSELKANPGLDGADLKEYLKCACARARLRYNAEVLGRVLDVVQPRRRAAAPKPEPPRVHWRDRCAHTPRCQTPTACALRAPKEDR